MMKKKTKSVLILVFLAVFCLLVFVSCNRQNTPNILDYSEDDLGVMGKLVMLMHKWIGNYGWTVVVFTVFLKIFMLPLDFWQRYASRKSTLKMQQMQPVIESIDKRYGANTQRANEEKQKLYKKQGFSMLSSCLPMIVSMVIFFIMFAGLRNYSTYSSITTFKDMYGVYYSEYSRQIDEDPELHAAYQAAIDDNEKEEVKNQIAGIVAARKINANKCEEYRQNALAAVKTEYEKNRESWLWIHNVWQPDTWATVMQPYDGKTFDGGAFSSSVSMTELFNEQEAKDLYNDLRNVVLEGSGYSGNGSWNGLMILPIMSIGLSFLSMFISQRLERKNRKCEVV